MGFRLFRQASTDSPKPRAARRSSALAGALALTVLAAPAALADEAEDAFVQANVLGIFYHELGHAMIDVMQLPVFGQEEDAADVASILLIDWLFEPEVALDLAYYASFGFAVEAMIRDTEGEDIAYWDTHGPDQQRLFNTVCIFYGANPDDREDFAADMGLPEDRADSCPEEFDLAWNSWGPVLDELSAGDGHPLEFTSDEDSDYADLVASEVEELNAIFSWPEPILVSVEPCDEPNAFYLPDERLVVMCSEFEPYLREIYQQSQ